jgi:phosphotransferase system  glucose/maltose/N-acetylglucosamine-specific IIC component
MITIPKYHIISRSISGLQKVNKYNSDFCTLIIVLSSTGLLFRIGTNSVRTISTLQIIEQVQDIINIIHSQC